MAIIFPLYVWFTCSKQHICWFQLWPWLLSPGKIGDRVRFEYLNNKIWKNVVASATILRLSRASFFRLDVYVLSNMLLCSWIRHGHDAAGAQPTLQPPPAACRRGGGVLLGPDGGGGVGSCGGGGAVDTGRATERLEPTRNPGRLRLPAPRPPLPRGTYPRLGWIIALILSGCVRVWCWLMVMPEI